MFGCVLNTPLPPLNCIYYQESPTDIDKEKGKRNIITLEMIFLIFMFFTFTLFSQIKYNFLNQSTDK